MQHNTRYWRWLILGLKGLTTMVEQQAAEETPGPDHAKELGNYVRRLAAVSERFAPGGEQKAK